MGPVFGIVFGLIWLGVVIYLVFLATRFVAAIERIADRIRPGGP